MVSGDRSNKITIAFKSDRCLYSRSTWTSCSLCVDSCPGKAIQSTAGNKPPSLDLARCMQCGQCLSACPLEAFESSSFSERQLFNRIPSEGDIRLHCFLPQSEHALLGSGTNTYQLGTCLASLTTGALFELSFFRTCELSTDLCRKCALFSRVGKTLECNMTSAFLLLSDWGKTTNLRETSTLFLSEVPKEHSSGHSDELAAEGETLDADATDIMRSSIRALFHGQRKRTQAKRSQLPLKAKERRVPSWRLRLKEQWERRGTTNEERCPWPVLVVDEQRCKACGICMQLCPTGSIRQVLGDGLFTYYFIPGTCVNCGLCIASCASGALARDYHPVTHPFVEKERSSQSAGVCARCGLPVLEAQGGPLCFLCSSEPDPRNLAERVRQQMRGISKARSMKKERGSL